MKTDKLLFRGIASGRRGEVMADHAEADKTPFRFSLRKLLVSMTICAVAFAILVKLWEMPLVFRLAIVLALGLVTIWIPFWLLSFVVSKRRLRLANVTYLCGFTFFATLTILVLVQVYDSQGLSFSLDVIALEIVLSLGAISCMSHALAIARSMKESNADLDGSKRQ